MKKVAFICVHNSCRSQIAEAVSKIAASDVYESFSAGTEIKKGINPEAVKAVKKIYGYDMESCQKPKNISELPRIDIVITMGCGVKCPLLPCKYREDWDIKDPTGKSFNEYIKTVKTIEENVRSLCNRIKENKI